MAVLIHWICPLSDFTRLFTCFESTCMLFLPPSLQKRHFYLWNDHCGCECDYGWMNILVFDADGCNAIWGTTGPYPVFMFSSTGSHTQAKSNYSFCIVHYLCHKHSSGVSCCEAWCCLLMIQDCCYYMHGQSYNPRPNISSDLAS